MAYPIAAKPVTRVIGDDWQFVISCTSTATGAPLDLSGYAPGGLLVDQRGTSIDVLPAPVTSPTGQFTLQVSGSTTSTLDPLQTYRLSVHLVDPLNLRRTYMIVPVQVLAP